VASTWCSHFLFRAEIALALDLASCLLLAPQALRLSSSRVGSPSLRSGPGILPILARKLALRGLSPDFTGGLMFCPAAFRLALPAAFNPPFGFCPSLRCQAGVFISSWAVYATGVCLLVCALHLTSACCQPYGCRPYAACHWAGSVVYLCSWLFLLCSLGGLLKVLGRRRCLGADLVHLLFRASGYPCLLGVYVGIKSRFHFASPLR